MSPSPYHEIAKIVGPGTRLQPCFRWDWHPNVTRMKNRIGISRKTPPLPKRFSPANRYTTTIVDDQPPDEAEKPHFTTQSCFRWTWHPKGL